jgi:hypothetical protein
VRQRRRDAAERANHPEQQHCLGHSGLLG